MYNCALNILDSNLDSELKCSLLQYSVYLLHYSSEKSGRRQQKRGSIANRIKCKLSGRLTSLSTDREFQDSAFSSVKGFIP